MLAHSVLEAFTIYVTMS